MPLDPAIPAGELLDLAVDAVFAVTADGTIRYVNAAAEKMLGYTAAELCGRGALQLVHPDDRAATLQSIAIIMAGEPSHRFENHWIRKDGRVIRIQWSARWSPRHGLRIAIGRELPDAG